jgi:hypothetical protein
VRGLGKSLKLRLLYSALYNRPGPSGKYICREINREITKQNLNDSEYVDVPASDLLQERRVKGKKRFR